MQLTFQNVTFAYRESNLTQPVIDDVSFVIKKGEFVGIAGRNGCGKSTLALLMAGLIVPLSGNVFVGDINTSTFSPDVQKKVGIIFQCADQQIVGITVEEDLAFGMENISVPRDEMIHRIDLIAGKMGLRDYLKKPVSWLSGGGRQKLAIASVLIMNPDFIILDEPTSQLDPWFRIEFWKIIQQIHSETGIGMIIISQRSEDLSKVNRLLVLDSGKLVYDGLSSVGWKHIDCSTWGIPIPESITLTQKFPSLFPHAK
ncbi:MAG: ATP-binding cassette domain-containing protein [Candidatus Riflebacteria bacterium]|nr:ATP-binding cassette domain-containing protein [Candidatus Riflebacteria bacterium]